MANSGPARATTGLNSANEELAGANEELAGANEERDEELESSLLVQRLALPALARTRARLRGKTPFQR